uniref:FAD/NAD(P)-binding domain-containing protein n=1 Tax=Mucochytrium quahogii TaxID=96639 RepID=A0A7S2SNS5_9STRA|mmetsp:Transcript_14084/g.23002  ORF Transcript_14084/g.23002 Transcript_14084/m.23002 type:complete len:470 (+) Transcript_14084:105-1514(+)
MQAEMLTRRTPAIVARGMMTRSTVVEMNPTLIGTVKTSRRVGVFARHLSSAMQSDKKYFDVLIIGGGNSAGYLCSGLKDNGFKGSVAIVSAESEPPYERPALSKAFLNPPDSKVRARLPGFHTCVGTGGERQGLEWYQENGITLMLDTHATQLDPKAKIVSIKNATNHIQKIQYGRAVIATGARAVSAQDINLPNGGLQKVFGLRDVADGLRLVKSLESNTPKNIVIVGGGYIGMETAAELVGWGANITVVWPEDTLMARLLPPKLAEIVQENFRGRGVSLLNSTNISGLVPSSKDAETVGGVKLEDGTVLPADLVLLGLGSKLNVEWLSSSGITSNPEIGGIQVDTSLRTVDKSVFAIGDIAAVDGVGRYEHVDFCRATALYLARVLTDQKPLAPFTYSPYFYSRLFEYTPTPLTFTFRGSMDGNCRMSYFGDLDAAIKSDPKLQKLNEFGAIWHRDGNVIGFLVFNS